VSGRLGHQRHHKDQLQTQVKPEPGSLQINLLFTIFAEQALNADRVVQTFTSSEDNDAFGTLEAKLRKAKGRRPSLAGPSGAQRRKPRQRQDTKWWS